MTLNTTFFFFFTSTELFILNPYPRIVNKLDRSDFALGQSVNKRLKVNSYMYGLYGY